MLYVVIFRIFAVYNCPKPCVFCRELSHTLWRCDWKPAWPRDDSSR